MVTDSALTLDLSFNNITVVTGDDLSGHRSLRVLSLHGNDDGLVENVEIQHLSGFYGRKLAKNVPGDQAGMFL